MRTTTKFLSFILAMILPLLIWGQCPSTITASTSVTPVTCPANGTITVTSNIPAGTPNVTYQIISGPTGGGYQTSPVSTNVYSSLPAGDYTIRVSCDAATTTVTATVANNYTAPTANTNVTNVCTNYAAGGTVTITSPGSATPLQYALLLSDDPNAPDTSFTYVGTNVFNVTAYGTYQARVKDACGAYSTATVTIQPKYPKVYMLSSGLRLVNCDGYQYNFYLRDSNNTSLNLGLTPGYKLEVWESASTTCSGTVPSGTPTQTLTQTGSATLRNMTVAFTTKSLIYRITTPCGDTTQRCIVLPEFPLNIRANPGCGWTADSVDLSIQPNIAGAALPATITVTGYDAFNNILFSGYTTTSTDSSLFQNIPYAHHYSWVLQTNCPGLSFTGSTTTPVTPAITFYKDLFCTSVIGTNRIMINSSPQLSIPDITNKVKEDFTLVNNTTGAVIPAYGLVPQEGYQIRFINVPPGDYTLHVANTTNSSTGCELDIPITINSQNVLTYSLTVNTSQNCGGTGNITATATTNSPSTVYYQLKNSSGTVIASSATGIFANVAAGTYTVVGGLIGCGSNYETTRQVTIAPAGGNPVVVKKYGITCDPDGNTTGTVFFEFSGAEPYVLQMKKTTETAFTTYSTSATNIYSVAGLESGATYDVFLQDACGNSATSQVTIQPLIMVNKLTTTQPCEGEPYTLAVDDIPGATYAWSYEGGPTISTSPSIGFTSYDASNNGSYVCTVTIGTCVVRNVTYEVNSDMCGLALPVAFGKISALLSNGILKINWVTETEIDNTGYEIELSNDGKNFVKIGDVISKADGGNSTETINYEFTTTLEKATGAMAVIGGIFILGFAVAGRRKMLAGTLGLVMLLMGIVACNKVREEVVSGNNDTLYIRIATVDKSGVKAYSKVVKVIKE
ncbi:MAG: hypothetical protein ACK5NK_16670 [Niabella sp.]